MTTWIGPLPWLLAVKTLDTNVVVRLLIGDDPQQTPIAEQAFLEAIASGAAARARTLAQKHVLKGRQRLLATMDSAPAVAAGTRPRAVLPGGPTTYAQQLWLAVRSATEV